MHSVSVNQEIQSNMTVVSHQGPPCNNQELTSQQNGQHIWGNSRASRRNATNSSNNKNNLNKADQLQSPRDYVNFPDSETIQNISHNVDATEATESWLESVDRRVKSADCQNNRALSENLETMRENARNSQELAKRPNSVNIMDIEQSMRVSRNSLSNSPNDSGCSMGKSVSTNSLSLGSSVSLSRSTDELDSSLRSVQSVDPHTAAIDLSNNCRQFYFNHLKTAESIKQSIRTTRHARARDKMEGKQPSRLDNAMHKLRTEMAELMDQDLSLMSQLLKLNDKIEDIKYQASLRGRQNSLDSSGSSYFGSTDMSDSETSDYEDSRIELTKSVNSPAGYVSAVRRQTEQTDVQLRSVDSSDKDIIVYRKRSHKPRKTKKTTSSSGEDTATEDNGVDSDNDDDEEEGLDAEEEEEEVFSSDEESKNEENTDTEHEDKTDDEDDEGSHSDTCSTISNHSDTSQNTDDSSKTQRKMSSKGGIQSPTPKSPEVPPKPVKGGVSRNSIFLDFHKNNGNAVRTAAGFNPLLTYQGHNVSAEKYYVPQSLVYLKHTKDENVFCQFQH